MFNLFKRKKPEPSYDYGAAIARLAAACQNKAGYSIILPSVFYDVTKGMFVVHFECAMKEHLRNGKFFLSIRRAEKIWGSDLETLLEFAVTYANYDDAFIKSPQANLPDGITMNIKNFNRALNGHTQNLPKWKV